MNPEERIDNLTKQLEIANDTITKLTALIVKITAQAEDDKVNEIHDTVRDNAPLIPGLVEALREHDREFNRDVYANTEDNSTEFNLTPTLFNGDLFGGA